MNKYEVCVMVSYNVEAEDENEAAMIAEELFFSDTHPIVEFTIEPIDD